MSPPQIDKSAQDTLKQEAAAAAVELVEDGMVVGLGHGSTALHAVHGIAERYASGVLGNILTIPCSRHIEMEAKRLGLPLATFDEVGVIDITIDGADEVDPAFNVIKGGGGALLREKVVAQATAREVIVVDASKLSPHLGVRWPVPLEVIPFALRPTLDYAASLGAKAEVRRMPTGETVVTDQGNAIIDCAFGPMEDPRVIAAKLDARAGIVEHGLFLNLVHDVIMAAPTGVRYLVKQVRDGSG